MLWGNKQDYYYHFAEEETEAQSSEVTCPSQRASKQSSQYLNPGSLGLDSMFLALTLFFLHLLHTQ